MGFLRHKPNCRYQKLEEELERLNIKEGQTQEEVVRILEIHIELETLEQNLVNDECPECGINQRNGSRSRERRAGFA